MSLVIRRMEGRRPGLGDLSQSFDAVVGNFLASASSTLLVLWHFGQWTGPLKLSLWPISEPEPRLGLSKQRTWRGQVSRSSHKLAGKPGDGDNSKRG